MSAFYIRYPLVALTGSVTANQGAPNTTANAWPIKITDGTNNLLLVNVLGAQHVLTVPLFTLPTTSVMMGWDGAAHREVALSATGEIKVRQPSTTVTGTITGTQNVSMPTDGISSVGVQVTGTWTGSLQLESSVDGVNFLPVSGFPLTGGLVATVISANNILQVNVSGMSVFRVRGATVSSGTAVITLEGASSTGPIVLSEPLPNGGNVIGLVGQSGAPWSFVISGTAPVTEAGFIPANTPTRIDYTVTPVTTGAYVQLVASITLATKEIEIFDSSGQTLTLAIGAAGAEVNQMLIFPGGNGRVKLAIPAASRISIKAVSATANVGEISINWYG